jgi:hypothetical protein
MNIFDAEEAHQRPDGPFAISTWHTDQTLADVLWDSLFTAFPDDAYEGECRSTVCLAIRAPNWAARARQAFLDPRAFSAQHLDEEAGYKPLERAGVNPGADITPASAGRSAPSR